MKKRIIACVLACAMLLMGSGYAYWTDLINVTAKADTGDLNVDFTDASYQSNNFEPTNALTDEGAYDTTTRRVAFNGNDVTLGISDLYPGHYEVFKTTVDNVGTVAAKLGKIDATLRGNGSVARDMIGIAVAAVSEYSYTTTTPDTTETVTDYDWEWRWVRKGFMHWELELVRFVVGSHEVVVPGTTTTTTVDGDVALGLPTGSTFIIDNVIFVRLSSLPDLNISEQTSNIIYVNNGSKMDFVVTVGMDPDAAGRFTTGSAQNRSTTVLNDSGTENKYEEVTLGLVWDQYNEQ